MNEISWENPYLQYKKKWGKNQNIDMTISENGNCLSGQSSNSFAEKFLAKSQQKLSTSMRDIDSSTFREYHSISDGQEAIGQDRTFMGSIERDLTDREIDNGFTKPYKAYHEYNLKTEIGSVKDSGINQSRISIRYKQPEISSEMWQFLGLKSRKQTGDIYQRLLAYKKKSGFSAFSFTSNTPKEGVTTILANLAYYIQNQRSEQHVLFIDANLNSPGLKNIFGISAQSPGLIEVIDRKIDLESVLFPIGFNMSFLSSGDVRNFRQNNLDPVDFVGLIQECKTLSDYLLIDCPSVLASSDIFSVAPASDVTFLVVQAFKARKQVAEKGLSELRNNECDVGGIIMNRVEQVIPGWVYKYI
ncbi:MAG: CpsD/CapB family tyrosine-protein kinase [Desulfotignum sp.]|nr:CpsD/CapB family tyrosine-protein kinase [Desulfotignum sp.]